MITTVTIKPNNFMFDRNKYYNNLTLLKNDLSEYVNILQINPDDLMETIINEIRLTPELIGATPICLETDTNIYQVCYAEEKEKNLNQNKISENPNKIVEFLINDSVENICVLINSKIGDNKICIHDSANLDTLTELLYSKFFHVGVIIKTDESFPVSEFVYSEHPLEYYKITTYDEDRFKILEFNFISLGLCAIIDKHPENNVINKRATRIIGKELIYGDILLILKLPDAYQDLTLNLYQKVDKLSFGSLVHRNLTEQEQIDPEKVNNLHVINNKYCILNSRLNSKTWEMSCAHTNCAKPDAPLKFCKGCYRVKYHDKECFALDWDNHKKECFYTK